jgi:methionyl-tRNA formyltransferase
MDVDLAYDSAIRADLLCDLMERHAAAGRLDVTDVQSVGEGRTYFVIHPVLKHIALLSIGKRSDD